jgi:hypothetical protein
LKHRGDALELICDGANARLRVPSAIEAGRDEVLADDWTRQAKAGLSDDAGIYLNYVPEQAVAAAK